MQSNLERTQRAQHAIDTKDASLEKLKECMRRELSAVETYELALKAIDHVGMHHTLQEIFVSHSRRTEQIGERIRLLGGEPSTSSGVWGAFAKAIQMGADLLGDRVIIAALEEGEDLTFRIYTDDLSDCDSKTRTFVQTVLMPEQRRTHDLCRSVMLYVNAPS